MFEVPGAQQLPRELSLAARTLSKLQLTALSKET
jgi:hypothetical protein